MPRIPRGQQGGYAYHVINRGNGRATVFHKAHDYDAFLSLLAEAKKRHPVKLFGFCLMPNHFHLALEPVHQTALSQFMLWLLPAMCAVITSITEAAGKSGRGALRAFRFNAMNI